MKIIDLFSSRPVVVYFFFFIQSLFSFGQDLEHLWSGKIGYPIANNNIYPSEVAIDKNNNKYITGKFEGTHDFDPGPGVFELTSVNGSGVYVLKLDSLNNFVWANMYYGGSYMVNSGITLDSSGGVYTYGTFEGTIDPDPQSPGNSVSSTSSYTDCYIHKYDSDGNFEWIEAWGNNDDEGIIEIIVDENQNFYILGHYEMSFDADPGPGTYTLTNQSSGKHAFIAKYDENFNFLWAKQYEGDGNTFVYDLELNAYGELTLTGKYDGIIDFDFSPQDTVRDTTVHWDLFTHVVDSSGSYKWHFTVKGTNNQAVNKSVQDSNKNRYILGSLTSSFDFNPSGTPNIIDPFGFSDSFIIKLDSLGNQLWTKAIQGEGTSVVQSLAFHNNQLIIYGSTSYETDTDPNSGFHYITPPFTTNELMFLQKLDGNGNVLWYEDFLGSMLLTLADFKIDKANNYFLIGQLSGTADMDPGVGVSEITHNIGSTTYFANFKELPCAPLGVDLTNKTNSTCSVSGSVDAIGINGVSPYNYTWLTSPQLNGPNLQTDTVGLFFVEITDASGCVDTNSVYIDGPNTATGFDLDVNLLSNNFIQGQPSMLWLDVNNGGCQHVSGTIQLVLDPLVQFDSASVSPSNIVGDTLFWNISNMNYNSSHFTTTLFVNTSQSAITGDTVYFQTQVDPFLGDMDTTNNVKEYFEPILASYDPNDKKVYPKGVCDDHVYMESPLTYTIRFQNTGNYEAINVNIIDTIDPNLDMSSFEVLAHSHPGLEVNHVGGREIQFNFENIYLPDSLSDPVGSNGYVIFKIFPRADININTVVTNEVNIFFDFNAPIITNMATTTFTNDIPCVNGDNVSIYEYEDSFFRLYPNPMQQEVKFHTDDGGSHSLTVYTSKGKAILTTDVFNGSTVSVKNLPSGLYFFNIDGNHVIKMVRF